VFDSAQSAIAITALCAVQQNEKKMRRNCIAEREKRVTWAIANKREKNNFISP
jgi:hypothetical protein